MPRSDKSGRSRSVLLSKICFLLLRRYMDQRGQNAYVGAQAQASWQHESMEGRTAAFDLGAMKSRLFSSFSSVFFPRFSSRGSFSLFLTSLATFYSILNSQSQEKQGSKQYTSCSKFLNFGYVYAGGVCCAILERKRCNHHSMLHGQIQNC